MTLEFVATKQDVLLFKPLIFWGVQIVEMVFSSRRFLQKTNERILLYYYETSGRLLFVRFLEEIEDTKKTFRNYLTFTNCHSVYAIVCITVTWHHHLYLILWHFSIAAIA